MVTRRQEEAATGHSTTISRVTSHHVCNHVFPSLSSSCRLCLVRLYTGPCRCVPETPFLLLHSSRLQMGSVRDHLSVVLVHECLWYDIYWCGFHSRLQSIFVKSGG
eukprot:TRINITY_DN7846_c0_g1_i1.p2 TRINITY_DN7846_c0_g1~~TRINITY_DN7846_c0_g1_i1.p2  ORF type:complete len:106 (-),score=3.72 TRINITY_DN7846_c0_g1_i1:3-320(-)